MVKIRVDDKEIEVEEGSNLLEVCLDNGIYIPNICHMTGEEKPYAACRLCFVEIDGRLVTSCTQKVEQGLEVRTDTPAVRHLQKSAFRLLLSVHEVKCKECPANRQCELQRIAKFLKIALKPKGLKICLKEPGIDTQHPKLEINQNHCVLCGKCIRLCKKLHGRSYLTFVKRGFNTVVSSFIQPEESKDVAFECLECIEICPVKAISLKKDIT